MMITLSKSWSRNYCVNWFWFVVFLLFYLLVKNTNVATLNQTSVVIRAYWNPQVIGQLYRKLYLKCNDFIKNSMTVCTVTLTTVYSGNCSIIVRYGRKHFPVGLHDIRNTCNMWQHCWILRSRYHLRYLNKYLKYIVNVFLPWIHCQHNPRH